MTTNGGGGGGCSNTYHGIRRKHTLLQPETDRVHIPRKSLEEDSLLSEVGEINFSARAIECRYMGEQRVAKSTFFKTY
jgi:hypothetical protein